MKFSLRLAAVAAVLLLTVSGFAASDAHKGTLQVFDAVQVNGKQLPAGEYQVKWEGNGPNVEATIIKSGKVVTTLPAHVVDLPEKAPTDTSVVSKNTDGSRSLTQIRFGGKKFALAVGEESARANTKSGDSSTQ
jgi:hypothetical protein